MVTTQDTASRALDAPMQWPIMLFTLEIGTRWSPKMVRMTRDSISSFASVAVPWALMKSTSLGSSPLVRMASRMAWALPAPSGWGRVMWCASQARP